MSAATRVGRLMTMTAQTGRGTKLAVALIAVAKIAFATSQAARRI